jgi:glucokinase
VEYIGARKMNYGIGIDLGGTLIKAVVMQENRVILKNYLWETNDHFESLQQGAPIWAQRIRQGISKIKIEQGRDPSWIGISSPGLADTNNKRITAMPGRLLGLENLDWEVYLDSPGKIFVLNDAQAALYGEVQLGAAKGRKDVIMLTLGTGVGGAIMLDGKLFQGRLGRAGHIGHLSVNYKGGPDICGTPGSIDTYIGDNSISERTEGRISSTKILVERYRQNDPYATSIWLESVRALAAAIASLINILDPEAIIIGGGIAKAGKDLFIPLHNFLDQFEWRPNGERVSLIIPNLKDYAGAIGASCFAKDSHQGM